MVTRVIVLIFGAVCCFSSATHAIDRVTTCQKQKLRAQGMMELCLKKNAVNMVGGDKTDMSAACQLKFQRALTKAGAACRYLDNGDGTVSDLDTGLMWEQKDNLDGTINASDPHDADNTYSWSASGTAADGTAYTDFLWQLNNGASTDGGASTPITRCFANHCDWRLPTIVELQGIADRSASGCQAGSPCIDPAFGPTQVHDYWSATFWARNPSTVWILYFSLGDVGIGGKTINYYVRAVRGGF